MSHAATNWAITQRGLKPAAKIVLWHLADCHNPSHGCFPSQDYLADRCEMSRSSLNEHLATLETVGLIRREQRRDSRTRRQENTRYRLAFETDFAGGEGPETTENPCPETGHGPCEAVSGKAGEPCPEKGESRVQNPDTNPVREPVKEPLLEGAGAREVDEEREDIHGSDREDDVVSVGATPSAGGAPDMRSLEKRVKRLAARLSWPGWANSSTAWTVAQFARLDVAAQERAESRAEAYLAHCGGKALSLGTYFADRKFDDLPASALAAPTAQAAVAPPFGKVWGVMRMLPLLTEAPQPSPPPTSAYIAGLVADPGEAGARERRKRQAHYGWPRVKMMDERAASAKGWPIPPGEAERLEKLAALTEQVWVGTATWTAWAAAFEARGWPFLPDMGRHQVASFPKGGPDGLGAFEAAVNGGRGHDERDAAE